MKKILVSLLIFLIILCGGFYLFKMVVAPNLIYLNASNEQSFVALNKLKSALQKEGKYVVLSNKDKHKSGNFNLYTATDINSLPEVIDKNAINVLWIDVIANGENAEPLRPFDVVIVKNLPGFGHLKAINVRSAFIPSAINIDEKQSNEPSKNVMFWGNGAVFSPSLYLAGASKFRLDVYGKGFENAWPSEDLKGEIVDNSIFNKYRIVLVDQTDDDLKNETLNPKIIQIVENGGLPLVRYNPAIEAIFGNAVPMYQTAEEFMPTIERLLSSRVELTNRKIGIKKIAKSWNTSTQAKKIIEIFEMMEKKRIK